MYYVYSVYSVHNKIGFADMAPRFRQMPTSSYQAITLIPLIRKMITQILVRRKRMIIGREKEMTMRDSFVISTIVLTRY